MPKRRRSESTENKTEDGFECPVCLTVKDPTFPFDCGHGVCDACDSELFCRADDKCPTCRAARLSDSISSRMSSPAFNQRRERALAQREMGNSNSGMIFFPAAGIIEIDATDFIVREERDEVQEEERPRNTSRIMTDPRIRDVVGALINAQRVPMSEFYLAVSALRASRPQRQRGETTR